MKYFLYFCKLAISIGSIFLFMRNVFIIVLLSVCYTAVSRVDGQGLPEKNTVVSLSDSAVEALYAEGKGLFLQKEYAKAVEVFSRMISLNASMAMAYNDRGSCYRMLGQFERAYEDYSSAIRFRPCALYYCNRGSVRVKMEDYEGAVSDYTLAYTLDTTYYLALNNRGIVYLNLGAYRRAVEDFSTCIRLNPSNHLLYNNRGIAYYKLKEFDKSISDFDMAISLNADYGNAYLHRGNLKEMLDDDAGACEDWSRASLLGVRQAESCLKNCGN